MAEPINQMIKQPGTGKPLKDVYVLGKGWYRWNPTFGVYNGTRNYDQLLDVDVSRIHFDLVAKNLTPQQAEQIDLVYSIIDHTRDQVIEDIVSGKIPGDWDGFELRWLLEARFKSRFGRDQKRRREEYENTVIVNNL